MLIFDFILPATPHLEYACTYPAKTFQITVLEDFDLVYV